MSKGSRRMIRCASCNKAIKKSEAYAVFIRRPKGLRLKDKFQNGDGSCCRTKLCEACAAAARSGAEATNGGGGEA